MPIQKDASTQSVQDFRAAVAASFVSSGAVLLNIIDALAVGPCPGSPVEVTTSALFAYDHNSLYQALRRGADALGEEITEEDWLRTLRTERLKWLAAHPPPPRRDDLGGRKIRILDATNHYRRQVKTVRVAYVHGAPFSRTGGSRRRQCSGPGAKQSPFQELGAATLSLINVGGTDHIRFDGIGLPGFQFIQDELEYDTRTHHTSQDVLERVQPEDLKQAAIIMAAFIYHTAIRDELLPRKSMPTQ